MYRLLLPFLLFASGVIAQGLQPHVFEEVPLGSIKPEGWLRDQLITMHRGSTGHLDEIHTKIARDNGWLGGRGDGWEETPYWLDGAVPLAFLLDDDSLKLRVRRYIEWAITHQRPSGYFGPITKAERENNAVITPANCAAGEDWWPRMIMLKVMQQYFEASGDERVIAFMTKYFDYQHGALKACAIGKWTEWATARGADNVMMVQWLYRRTKDARLLELAQMLDDATYPWSDWLGGRDWVIWAAANQTDEHWMRRHAVNVGMALKAPVINYERTGDRKFLADIETGWSDLMNLHGLPMGIFSGDEDLHGNAPTQGIELCAIVETMFSLEKIIAVTGDMRYADALERIAFNALPAQTTDSYNEKQYFQVANQVEISRGVFDFSLPFDRQMNNVLGLRSGYTCCTANMHQGWTKFASHLWYRAPDGGVAAIAYAPNTLSVEVGRDRSAVTIRQRTDYPFDSRIIFEVNAAREVSFPVYLRIPAWCRNPSLSVNGEKIPLEMSGALAVVRRAWKNDVIELELPMEITTSSWGKNSRAVERGPLVYALKLKERWEKGTEPKEGDYYSVYPESAWNFGLMQEAVKDPSKMKATVKPVSENFAWNLAHAPIEISVPAKKIPGWIAVNGVAHQPVTDREGVYKGQVDPEVHTVTLVPYGFTKVRIVAFPVVR